MEKIASKKVSLASNVVTQLTCLCIYTQGLSRWAEILE